MAESHAFIPSPIKMHIREDHDKSLVQELYLQMGRKLSYLGLPGPHMHDIITWQEWLEYCVAVEYDEQSKDLLLEASFLSGFSSKLKVIQDDIDNYIINTLPQKEKNAFDIINLDYYGAPLNLNKMGESNRYKAFEGLFDYQTKVNNPNPFILFVTNGVRNKDKGQIDLMLEDIKRHVDESLMPPASSIGYSKMKVIVPYLIRSAAASRKWDITLKYGITYKGSNNIRMVHFAFWAKPSNIIVVDHQQTMAEVCLMPLTEILDCR